jgi:GNAT superfamily N-acetyltransferase
MIIRTVRYEDIDELTEMGARMHTEGAYGFLLYDREKVRQLITSYIDDSETRCGLVAEEYDVLLGMLFGYLTEYFFCKEKLACDMVLFVDRKHRGSSAAARLIGAFRNWAVACGASEICLGISSKINIERTGRFYERMGLTHVGGVYKQRLVY